MKKFFLFLSCIVVYTQLYSHINLGDPAYDPTQMFYYIKQFLPNNPIILEAGANCGEDTQKMNGVWPEAIIHAFEPFPLSFNALQKNITELKNTYCYNCALSTYIGQTNFYVNPGNNGASSIGYPVDYNKAEFDLTPIQVPCTTIDEWAKNNNITHVDFMWLDMEGHELYALQHGLSILDSVKVIYTEIDYVPIHEDTCLYPDLKKFLEEHRFSLVWKYPDSGRQGNALFIRRN